MSDFGGMRWGAQLWELPGVCYDVCESSSFQELHDDPEFVSHQETIIHVDDVGVVVVPHYDHLKQKALVVKHISSKQRTNKTSQDVFYIFKSSWNLVTIENRR